MGGTAASVDASGLERFAGGVTSSLFVGTGLGVFLALERVDLGIVAAANSFRLSSFVAALTA